MIKFQEIFNNMKKENEEKYSILSQQFEKLQKAFNEQKDMILAQRMNIDSSNNIYI